MFFRVFFIFFVLVYPLKAQDFVYSLDGKIFPVDSSLSKKIPDDKQIKEDIKNISLKEEKKLEKEVLKIKDNNLKILFVGDSMVEAIKKPSTNICIERKLKCDYLFRRGLRTDAWVRDRWYSVSLILKLAEFKPDIVVISSGTNDIYNKESIEEIYKDFKNLINIIKSVSKSVNINPKIVIVAPPIPNDKNLNDFLNKKFTNIKNIYVIQSKNFHLKLWDGIHPNIDSSKVWAKKIISFIEKVNNN